MQRMDWLNHDYIVIELRLGGSPAEKIYIRAERVGDQVRKKGNADRVGDGIVENAGINISLEAVGESDFKDVQLHSIDCHVCIPLESLVETRKREKPNYHLKDANCWDYARNTTMALLEKCIELAGNEQEKAGLQKEHGELEKSVARLHMWNTWEKFVSKHMRNTWFKKMLLGGGCEG